MKKQLLLALPSTILMASCAPTGSFETKAVCQELRVDLPSWSTRDTTQSREEGARFLLTFDSVCPQK